MWPFQNTDGYSLGLGRKIQEEWRWSFIRVGQKNTGRMNTGRPWLFKLSENSWNYALYLELSSHLDSSCLHYAHYSRYLELGYLEFCKIRSVYHNQIYILIAFSNHNVVLETFYQSKLPEVQINLHFGQFELVQNSPNIFEILSVYCIYQNACYKVT